MIVFKFIVIGHKKESGGKMELSSKRVERM